MKAQYSPDRIADRMAIQDTIYRYCRAVDRLDLEGLRAVYHPDGGDTHGANLLTVDGLIEWVRERHKTIPFSMHCVSNTLIEFAGPDLALVETYVRVVRRFPPDAKSSLAQYSGVQEDNAGTGADLFSCSRYVDRFERRNGEWRILHRKVIQEWMQIVDISESALKRLEIRKPSPRSKEDFLYRERAALGLGK